MSDTFLRRKEDCRLCGATDLERVLSLAPTPPANAFVPAERRNAPQTVYPLELFLCRACGHVQLAVVLDPAMLYRDYVYISGTSPVFIAHFRNYAQELAERASLRAGDLVVDIGSNDGTFLRFFRDGGQRVLGIDPARKIATRASQDGIETLAEFFTPALAAEVRAQRGPARAIAANNVLAHIDDLGAVVEGVRTLLAPDGVFVFEVSYLVDVLDKVLFDTIYHEHLDYHALGPLIPFLAAHGLEIFDAWRVPSHGGSIRVYVQHEGGPRRRGSGPDRLLAIESEFAVSRPDTFAKFATRIERLKSALAGVVDGLRGRGARIAGFGAPAKATTLLHHFELGGVLDFIVDDNPLKQGLFTPGHHIPVLSVEALYARRPEAALLLAWNFADSIVERHRRFAAEGGRFILPLPEVRILP